jgi:hypothetical protein
MTKKCKSQDPSQYLYGGDKELKRRELRQRAKDRMGSSQVHNDLYHQFKQENRWTMFGKHYGTPLEQLPQSYLIWVINNLNGKYKEFAEKEFYRRKSTNT